MNARSGVVFAATVVPGKAAVRSRRVNPSSAVGSVGVAERGECVTGNKVCISETAAAEEEVVKPAVRETSKASASCGVRSSLKRGAVTRRASADAGCLRATGGGEGGGVLCVVQW